MSSRRAFLRQVVALGGLGTLAIPSVFAEAVADAANANALSVLSTEQAGFLSQLADHIIPSTDTPGASEVGVVSFIDSLLARWYEPHEVRAFLQGLDACLQETQTPLSTRYVASLDSQCFNSNPPATTPQVHFYRTAKELVLVGYFTSKDGSLQNLHTHGPVGNYSFEPSGPPGDPIKY